MSLKTATRVVVFFLAFLVLGISFFEISGIKYAYSGKPGNYLPNRATGKDVIYDLPFPGRVMPNNPLYPIKVLRDRIFFRLAGNTTSKASTALKLADKRLSLTLKLWNEGNVNEAIETGEKAIGYLVTADIYAKKSLNQGNDVHDLLRQIDLSSLKHRQILETMLSEAPEGARPTINKLLTDPKRVDIEISAVLTGNGYEAPLNPF